MLGIRSSLDCICIVYLEMLTRRATAKDEVAPNFYENVCFLLVTSMQVGASRLDNIVTLTTTSFTFGGLLG